MSTSVKKEVELLISGRHSSAGEEGEQVERIVSAVYYEREGSRYLLYEETMEETGERVKSRIKIGRDRMELVRGGENRTHMIFEEKKRHPADYVTPYGRFALEVETKEVRVEEVSWGIQAMIRYGLWQGEQSLSESCLRISVRER